MVFPFIKRNYEFQSVRDLSRQSDPKLAPADVSDCKYLFYTVFYQIFNRKMGKNVQAIGNTDRNMGQGPERMSKGHLDRGI